MGLKIKYYPDSIAKLHFNDNFFDKIYCISVIEHLPEKIAYKGMNEMARVLKKGGLMIITLDLDGIHVTPSIRGKYKNLINP